MTNQHPDNNGQTDKDGSGNDPKLIDFSRVGASPFNQMLLSVLARPIEKSLFIDELNALYTMTANTHSGENFFGHALQAMKITYSASRDDLEKIPKKGPLLLVANHPFGGIEGMVLADLLLQLRGDAKILGNYLLHHIPEIQRHIIPVDPFGNPGSAKANIGGLKDAIRWLKEGGALIAFPAGEVSHLQFPKFQITDPQWTDHMGALIRLGNAGTVPVYIPGRNSLLFQMAGMIHPRLRTVLLPREMIKKRQKHLSIFIGKPIGWKKLAGFETDRQRVDFLRLNTYFLKHRIKRKHLALPFLPRKKADSFQSLIASPQEEVLRKEIAHLPDECKLVEKDELAVYLAQSNQIPHLVNEIGRLRELTFRQVGEGTGKALDLDRFDEYYFHLCLWDSTKSQLVGAYRLGPVDRILKAYGIRGLYSSTLFRFGPEFIEKLGAAVEIGRSFIRSEYQKKYNSLLMLWQGIGAFISRNPRYRVLFGPVSISHEYHSVSKNLLVRFLKENNAARELASLVKPRNPFRLKPLSGIDRKVIRTALKDIEDVCVLISEIEEDGKTVPVLIRHYLKLNADLISFNVDNQFSKVIDGLIRVDLANTDPKLLKRFMGHAGYEGFCRHHDAAPELPRRCRSRSS